MKPFTILIVDDVPANVGVLLDVLGESYRVLVAESGEACLEQLPHCQPDLILLDVKMPGIDGFETFRRLRETTETADVPVIFMTAIDEPEQKSRAIEMGAVDYVTKPVYVPEVIARVRTHLDIISLRRSLEVQKEQLELEVLMRRETEDQLQSSIRQAILSVTDDGQVAFATRLAQTLLLRYFGKAAEIVLPEAFQAKWLEAQADPAKSRWHFEHPEVDSRLEVERFECPGDHEITLLRLEESGDANAKPADLAALGLSPRETEVLFWISEGKSNPDIAAILSASVRTIHKHVENIFRKLNVENRASAIRLALETFQNSA